MNGEGEVHRLKELPENYDVDLFNSYYKSMTPLIRNLVRHIDPKRFNITKDILQSYFYDKLLYVFTKYYDLADSNPEKFKATIISSLSTLKYRILRNAYCNTSVEFNLQTHSFEDCFEDSRKDDIPDLDEAEAQKQEKIEEVYEFMRNQVSKDAYLLFQIGLNPPAFIKERLRTENAIIPVSIILEFFELPKTNLFIRYISDLRNEIKSAIESAKHNLG